MPRSAGHVQGPDGRARGRPRPCGVRGLQLCSKLRRVRVRSNGSPGLPAGEHAKMDRATNAQSRIADLTRRSYRFHPPPSTIEGTFPARWRASALARVRRGRPRRGRRIASGSRSPSSRRRRRRPHPRGQRRRARLVVVAAAGPGRRGTWATRTSGVQVSPRRMEPTDIYLDRQYGGQF